MFRLEITLRRTSECETRLWKARRSCCYLIIFRPEESINTRTFSNLYIDSMFIQSYRSPHVVGQSILHLGSMYELVLELPALHCHHRRMKFTGVSLAHLSWKCCYVTAVYQSNYLHDNWLPSAEVHRNMWLKTPEKKPVRGPWMMNIWSKWFPPPSSRVAFHLHTRPCGVRFHVVAALLLI